MSDHGDDLERQLAEALAARASTVEPSGTNSLEHIEQRIGEQRNAAANRHRLFIALGAAAAIALIVGAIALVRNDDKQAVTVVPAASESTTTSTTTTSTTRRQPTPWTPPRCYSASHPLRNGPYSSRCGPGRKRRRANLTPR